MFPEIEILVQQVIARFENIPAERQEVLAQLSAYIQKKVDLAAPIALVYICTHNSRRSHFGQIAAAVAASYYQVQNVHTYSGGTEATAFHPNAIAALRNVGFEIEALDETKNPVYEVRFAENQFTVCYSKVFDDAANPRSSFAAVMTCSDADENCPFIPGAEVRIGTTYVDPKISDGTPEQLSVYQRRFEQILLECLYVFSQIKSKAL